MKRITQPGTILVFDGKLARVVGIGEGKSLHLEFIGEEPCGTCGHQPGDVLLEHAPLFQNGAHAVLTVGGGDDGPVPSYR